LARPRRLSGFLFAAIQREIGQYVLYLELDSLPRGQGIVDHTYQVETRVILG
jgi:hypothetical protein